MSTTAAELAEAMAHTPLDQYVIWDGSAARVRANSLPHLTLECVREIWTPVSLRAVLHRAAARLELTAGKADRIRNAVRAHQHAQPATHFLVRRTASDDYLAVTDIPWPASAQGPLRPGDVILDSRGRAFGWRRTDETVRKVESVQSSAGSLSQVARAKVR